MKHDNVAIELIQSLPAKLRRTMRLSDFEQITGAVLVKEKIQSFFQQQAREQRELTKWKVANGYCGGHPVCMTFVGKGAKHSWCETCRTRSAQQGRTYKEFGRSNKPSAYGMIRRTEKAQDRAERERLGK